MLSFNNVLQNVSTVCRLFYFYTTKQYNVTFKNSSLQGLSQAAPLRQSRTAIGIVPLKNGQGDNLSPSKFREKHERKHTRRDLLQYRNCKLKQNVVSIFYRTFKVHSKVTLQSHSTAIFVGNLRQGF